MDLSHGGHLTHGAPVSHMGRIFHFERYKTLPVTGEIDYDQIRSMALVQKPRLILCGYSSYPRALDYSRFKEIADEVGAYTMADISHYGGLVAGNSLANPLDYGFDVVTTTTHKSLRGPRGGLILCKQEFAKAIDSSVFPGLQGGPHMNQVAAVAVTLKHAASQEFKQYCQQVLSNAQALAQSFINNDIRLITGGTENHLLVLDTMTSFNLDGRDAQELLDSILITTNKQVIPDDPLPPYRGSGIRIGTPAATSRGMTETEMKQIAHWIIEALKYPQNKDLQLELRKKVQVLCSQFAVPGLD